MAKLQAAGRERAKFQTFYVLLTGLLVAAMSLWRSFRSSANLNLNMITSPEANDLACQKIFESEPWASIELRDYCSSMAATPDWVPCAQMRRVQRDDTLIIANVDCGYVDFAINFWRSYQRLGHSNIIFLAEDCHAYVALVAIVGADHVAPPLFPPMDTNSDLAVHDYGSKGFARLVLSRPVYLQYFTRAGYR